MSLLLPVTGMIVYVKAHSSISRVESARAFVAERVRIVRWQPLGRFVGGSPSRYDDEQMLLEKSLHNDGLVCISLMQADLSIIHVVDCCEAFACLSCIDLLNQAVTALVWLANCSLSVAMSKLVLIRLHQITTVRSRSRPVD